MLEGFPTELLFVAFLALILIGPKDLPRVLRFVGKWVARARGITRQFRSGLDEMIRESELADLKKQWEAENERILREYPPGPALPDPANYSDHVENAVEPVTVEQPQGNVAAAVEPAAAKPKRRATKPKTVAAPVVVDAAAPKKVSRPRTPKAKAAS